MGPPSDRSNRGDSGVRTCLVTLDGYARAMTDELKAALSYAQADTIWLERPAQQHRHIQVLAAEVLRLRAENTVLTETKTVFKRITLKGIDHVTRTLTVQPK